MSTYIIVIQIIIIAFLAIVAFLVALLTGLLAWAWLALFKTELNLKIGTKTKSPPDHDQINQ